MGECMDGWVDGWVNGSVMLNHLQLNKLNLWLGIRVDGWGHIDLI